MPADGRHVACAAPGAAFGARVGAEDFSPMEDADGLCAALQLKLRRWEKLGEAPEYYELRNRGPYKPTVMHEHNRFGGQMGPYEDSLLSLQSVEYINASPIDNAGPGAPRFIATMCPKQTTFAHFWSMVWEIGSTVIVNLTHFKDRVGSEPTDKRERYWPPFDAPSITAQARRWPVVPRTRGCEACEQVPGLQRWAVELTGPPEAGGGARPTRVVTLYWYSRWVDFPSSSSIGSRPFFANAWAVLHLAIHLGALLKRKPDDHWAVCHCSAGVGRTGTLIALLALLCPGGQAPASGADFDEIIGAFDARVASTIEAMRERRLWMVKTDCECARAAAPLPPPATRPRYLTCLRRAARRYATLYAAVMLRLRNPRNEDFALTWWRQEGDCSALHDDDAAPEHAPAGAPAAAPDASPDASPDALPDAALAVTPDATPGVTPDMSAEDTPDSALDAMSVDDETPAPADGSGAASDGRAPSRAEGEGEGEHRAGEGGGVGGSEGGECGEGADAEVCDASPDVDNDGDVAHYAVVGSSSSSARVEGAATGRDET